MIRFTRYAFLEEFTFFAVTVMAMGRFDVESLRYIVIVIGVVMLKYLICPEFRIFKIK